MASGKRFNYLMEMLLNIFYNSANKTTKIDLVDKLLYIRKCFTGCFFKEGESNTMSQTHFMNKINKFLFKL